jgi:hypothetical protein
LRSAPQVKNNARVCVPIDVDASEAPGFVRWSIRGPWPAIAETSSVREALIANGQLTTETRALFDLRNVETVPSYHEVAAMIEGAMKAGGLPLVRAYLVGSALQFGIVRQMKALAPPHIKVETFFREAEAVAWLWDQK